MFQASGSGGVNVEIIIGDAPYRDLSNYSAPFQGGARGFLGGAELGANPYAPDSEDHAAWAAGWQDACAGGEALP